jgi:hypothetical protein
MAHTNTKVWVSPREQKHDRWLSIEENLKRIRFDRSWVVPQTFAQYVEHLAARAEDSVREERLRITQREAVTAQTWTSLQPWNRPFGGKSFLDNRSPVLAQLSIWSPWYSFTNQRPEAPWPSHEEFREEGDERHTSGFGRFLPVPRVPGNETVAWKQKAFMDSYPLDQVDPVPRREPSPRFTPMEAREIEEMYITGRLTEVLPTQAVDDAVAEYSPIIQWISSPSQASVLADPIPSIYPQYAASLPKEYLSGLASGLSGQDITFDSNTITFTVADIPTEQCMIENDVAMVKKHACLLNMDIPDAMEFGVLGGAQDNRVELTTEDGNKMRFAEIAYHEISPTCNLFETD